MYILALCVAVASCEWFVDKCRGKNRALRSYILDGALVALVMALLKLMGPI